MTILTYYQVHCTKCGRSSKYSEDTPEDALDAAKSEGFQRKLVPNDSYWDFCPRCVENMVRGEGVEP